MSREFKIVNGAGLDCAGGSIPSTTGLIVASSEEKAEGQSVAVISDLIVGTFGTCTYLGPGPCVPILIYPAQTWAPGCTKNKLGGLACVKETDQLVCGVNPGGIITVNDAGQTKVLGE